MEKPVYDIVMLPNGKEFIASSMRGKTLFKGSITPFSGALQRWSIEDGKCTESFDGHEGSVVCIKVKGDVMITGCNKGFIIVWNLIKMNQTNHFEVKGAPWSIALFENKLVAGK